MSRNVCGPLVDKGGFGFVPPAKSGPIASAARRTESRVGLGPPGTACHCTLREAHRAFGIGHSVRRKPSEGRAISPCSSGSLPRKGRTQRGTTNHKRVGMGRTAWLKALYYDCLSAAAGRQRGVLEDHAPFASYADAAQSLRTAARNSQESQALVRHGSCTPIPSNPTSNPATRPGLSRGRHAPQRPTERRSCRIASSQRSPGGPVPPTGSKRAR